MIKLSYEKQLDLALGCTDAICDYGLYSLNTVSCLLFLICHEYNRHEEEPIHLYERVSEVQKRIVTLVRIYINGGREPSFDLGPHWWAAVLCECFSLIKHANTLWELFTEDEHARITQLMKMYAYMWNFGCNEDNSYGTGWGLKGDYGKWRGPNYRLSNNALIIFIADFFGGIDKVNELFAQFNYQEELLNLQKFGFTRALKSWTTKGMIDNAGRELPGAESLLNNGGDAYIKSVDYGMINYYKRGSGKGVRIPYKYHDGFPNGIIHAVYNHCFSGGKCTSEIKISDDYVCSIIDGTISPVEEQEGMMLEFNLKDDGLGPRSSLFHCATDFYLMSAMVVSCQFLHIANVKSYKGYKKIKTGVTDFIYKLFHGYQGWCLGEKEDSFKIIPSGLILWSNYWADYYDIKLPSVN